MHHRKSYRLKGYDYTREGLYYITICTKNRELLFGVVDNQMMYPNPVGNIANHCWVDISNHFPNVCLHGFVIMPNHMHAIIELLEPVVRTRHGVSLHGESKNAFGKPIHGSIPTIINQYKSAVKRWCNKNNHGYFQWQSRYYDHIIRSFDEYERITDYIRDNPAKWKYDSFYHKG